MQRSVFGFQSSKTRFTAGPSYGTKQIFGSTTLHAMGGVEQPFTKHFSLIADYFSGNHDLGALITAVQITPVRQFIIIAGAKFPNDSSRAGPIAGLLELTYEFDLIGYHANKAHRASSGR